jgi:hypothetical protein
MRVVSRHFLTLTVLSTALACAGHRQVGQINPKNAASSTQWNATLSTPAGMTGAVDVDGNASLAASGVSTSLVTVSITNAAPNGAHPWHLYLGQCGDASATVVGAGTTYPPLKVDKYGKATATATLPMALPTSGSYFVAVNASEANMQTVVACGNLAPPNAT